MSDEVSGFVDSTRRLLEHANSGSRTGLNEQATCEDIVTNLISTLGWKPVDKQRPFDVKMGSQTKQVDYALFTSDEDEPEVFVEAKAEKHDLQGTHLEQLRSYMRQEWVEWGLLTNGRRYQLVRLLPQSDEAPTMRVLIDVGLDELVDSFLPDILSKGAMESGEAREIGDDLQSRMDAIEVLRSDESMIAEAVRSVDSNASKQEIGRSVVSKLHQSLVVEAKAIRDEGPAGTFRTGTRADIDGDGAERVVWMSSRPGGVEFLREHGDWGFVKYPRREPTFLALYISAPIQELRYVGRIEDVIPTREFEGIDDALRQQNEGKYVIKLSEIIELEDPIPFGEGEAVVRGPTYTTLERLQAAATIDDL